jgi:hypothetical protein
MLVLRVFSVALFRCFYLGAVRACVHSCTTDQPPDPSFARASLTGACLQGDWFRENFKRRNRRKPRLNGRGRAGSRASRAPSFNPSRAPNILKPLAAMVVSKAGHLQCPPAIVEFRRVVAQTPLCRALRPQDLPFKLAASGMLSAMANLAPGAAKEHFDKFSVGWFVAIHLSIPFVAALRKAIVMPPYALIITIGGAVAGQIIGGRLERARMVEAREHAAQHPDAGKAVRGPDFAAIARFVREPWADDSGLPPTVAVAG